MLALLAVAAGLAVGVARGGRLAGLGDLGVRHLWLPVVGVAALAYLRIGPAGDAPGVVRAGVLGVSFASMGALAALNRTVRGVQIVAAGALLNVLVIVLNAGMPVSRFATRIAGLGALHPGSDLLWGKHVVAGADTRLSVLADIIPVAIPGLRQVISIGDVVVLAGIAVLVASAVLRAGRVPQDAPAPT